MVLKPLPFKESVFESVSAYDFLEHIPRFAIINNQTTFPFIHLMNEIYRVLKPGGTFYAITPCYPRDEAFVDPTHVNIITNKTHTYFTSPQYKARMYGFTGSFEINRVKRIKPSQETRPHKNFILKFFKNIYYTIRYKKKSHLLWEFIASKN